MTAAAPFSPQHVIGMKRAHELLESVVPSDLPTPDEQQPDQMSIVAGTIFWVRYASLQPAQLAAARPALDKHFTAGYILDFGLEHAIERLLASRITASSQRILQMPPAPKPIAFFFPQYHPIPENDRFWGTNYTDWDFLKPFQPRDPGEPPVHKPLSAEQGGLGYYNLLDYDVRKRQAELARAYGIHGFCFYHCEWLPPEPIDPSRQRPIEAAGSALPCVPADWFSGKNTPEGHKVMHRVPELMLADGQPNVPFMFSWANEPWERTWSGSAHPEGDSTMINQLYGDEADWREHFEYLLPFFRHPNYIKVAGQPALALYRIGHIGSLLPQILGLWRQLAKEAGLPGLHIIATLGSFVNEEGTAENYAYVDAALDFAPSFQTSYHLGGAHAVASHIDVPDPVPATQYWGAGTGFDKRPRVPDSVGSQLTPETLGNGLRVSFESMVGQPARRLVPNLFFVNAWNEWNEQATLEPDDLHENGFLRAFRMALVNCAARELVRGGGSIDPPPDKHMQSFGDGLLRSEDTTEPKPVPDISCIQGDRCSSKQTCLGKWGCAERSVAELKTREQQGQGQQQPQRRRQQQQHQRRQWHARSTRLTTVFLPGTDPRYH